MQQYIHFLLKNWHSVGSDSLLLYAYLPYFILNAFDLDDMLKVAFIVEIIRCIILLTHVLYFRICCYIILTADSKFHWSFCLFRCKRSRSILSACWFQKCHFEYFILYLQYSFFLVSRYLIVDVITCIIYHTICLHIHN